MPFEPDFAPAFTKVHDDTSFYYLLGYISNNPAKDGRYRRITVQLNRADVKNAKLDFRKGYYAPADFQHTTKETREQQLQDQLTSDVPTSDFPVYVSTAYFRMAENRYFVPVSVVVPGSQIPFTRASEQDRGDPDREQALCRSDHACSLSAVLHAIVPPGRHGPIAPGDEYAARVQGCSGYRPR